MKQSQITFNAELINNEILIRLISHNDDQELGQELACKAAKQLFTSLEKIGIEVTRKNLENDWNLEI